MFTPQQISALGADLARANVKKNPRGYDYVEGWMAIAEANRIFGFDGWQRETLDMQQLGEPELVNGNYRVAYRCRVRVTVFAGEKTIVRDGSGYGSGIVKDVRDAHEGAIKEAETDAMKRALMTFGNPFGLALYDKKQAQVSDAAPMDESAKMFVEKCREKILTFDSIVELAGWWNSEEQKKARRDFGLDQKTVEELKNEVMGRKSILEQGKKAA